ncbi:MAG: hypothetical protein AB9897_07065 [Anaerolineaceae bacterium]
MSDSPIPERQRKLPDHPAVISQLDAVFSEDQRKVKVSVQLSSGDTHPDLELILKSADGLEICRTTIIENFGPSIAFTMHIRPAKVIPPLSVTCLLIYLDDQVYSEKETVVQVCEKS